MKAHIKNGDNGLVHLFTNTKISLGELSGFEFEYVAYNVLEKIALISLCFLIDEPYIWLFHISSNKDCLDSISTEEDKSRNNLKDSFMRFRGRS